MNDSNKKTKGAWSEREIGALWLQKSQAGNKYLGGHLVLEGEGLEENREKITVWANKDKKNEKAPDYRIYRSEPKQQDSSSTVTPQVVESEESEEELDVL
tara:strand:- start:955 stop:1254 length:300 start_codon:yes stop_codon:yes gene_type:complete